MGKRITTIVIPGNHDTNLANENRMDSLSVIAVGIPNVHYLRESGIYSIGNISFGVSSVFEHESRFISAESISRQFISNHDNNKSVNDNIDKLNRYKIALYHGPVNGCKSSVGFKISGISQKMFTGYDYVFLGDIHQYQYLNREKTIAYSSSLIQQHVNILELRIVCDFFLILSSLKCLSFPLG